MHLLHPGMRPLRIGIIKRTEEVLADERLRDLHREGVLDRNRIHERRADRRKHSRRACAPSGHVFPGSRATHVEINSSSHAARVALIHSREMASSITRNPHSRRILTAALRLLSVSVPEQRSAFDIFISSPTSRRSAALVPLRFALCGLSVVTPLMEDNSSRSTRPRSGGGPRPHGQRNDVQVSSLRQQRIGRRLRQVNVREGRRK